jgi:hypothetical protein
MNQNALAPDSQPFTGADLPATREDLLFACSVNASRRPWRLPAKLCATTERIIRSQALVSTDTSPRGDDRRRNRDLNRPISYRLKPKFTHCDSMCSCRLNKLQQSCAMAETRYDR